MAKKKVYGVDSSKLHNQSADAEAIPIEAVSENETTDQSHRKKDISVETHPVATLALESWKRFREKYLLKPILTE